MTHEVKWRSMEINFAPRRTNLLVSKTVSECNENKEKTNREQSTVVEGDDSMNIFYRN